LLMHGVTMKFKCKGTFEDNIKLASYRNGLRIGLALDHVVWFCDDCNGSAGSVTQMLS